MNHPHLLPTKIIKCLKILYKHSALHHELGEKKTDKKVIYDNQYTCRLNVVTTES